MRYTTFFKVKPHRETHELYYSIHGLLPTHGLLTTHGCDSDLHVNSGSLPTREVACAHSKNQVLFPTCLALSPLMISTQIALHSPISFTLCMVGLCVRAQQETPPYALDPVKSPSNQCPGHLICIISLLMMALETIKIKKMLNAIFDV